VRFVETDEDGGADKVLELQEEAVGEDGGEERELRGA
jgi:hypothetical protein